MPCDRDLEEVAAVLLEAVRGNPSILTSLTSTVEVGSLGQCVLYNLKIWTKDPLGIDALCSDLYRRIYITLGQHGIQSVALGEFAVEQEVASMLL